MKLYLTDSTAGRYGSFSLNGNLRYLDKYIQKQIDKESFGNSFEELWINFAFPPLYLPSKVLRMRAQFLEWYNYLPYTRVQRRYKKVDISIRAPEFSEHFELKEQAKHQHQFAVDDAYQGIIEIELARILMDKLVEAIELIEPKINASDNFNSAALKQLFREIKSNLSLELLVEISKEEASEVKDEAFIRALSLRKDRKANPKGKDKNIRDLRVYYVDLPTKALYPYDYQYSEIFLNLLSQQGLRCPQYHHLYILVGEKEGEIIRRSIPMEEWYVNGIALIDYQNYLSETPEQQDKVVFDLICAGLLDIAKIDQLDLELINRVIAQVKEKGLDTELLYKRVEHKNYTLTITYLARSMEDQCPVFFHIEDKKTNRKYKKQIGRADKFQVSAWLQKISLTRTQIKVRSSTSVRSEVILKNMKRELVFDLAGLMVKGNEVK